MLDALTKIPTLQALSTCLKSAQHPKLILIDLKEFEKLNLTYGDEAGDFVLCSFAKELESFAKAHDMEVFRVKEDEFALIKDMPFDLTVLEKLIYSISDFIKAQSYTYKNKNINIDAHIGLCLDQNNLLEKAYKALKVAKKEDQPFVTYSDFVNKLLEEGREEISSLLQQSLENGTLVPYYQRVIDLDGNNIYNEILLRNEMKDSIQAPKLFLNIAHERGFYNDIVKLVSKNVIKENGAKAMNFSAIDFFDEDLFNFLNETFKDTNTVFEVQDDKHIHMENLDYKLEILQNNKIKICLDNVKDNSNIAHLNLKHIDYVKLSGDIIRLLSLSDEAHSTCKEIILTCKESNIKTIAPHINSNHSFEEAKNIGFDYYQGYFFGKPTSSFSE